MTVVNYLEELVSFESQLKDVPFEGFIEINRVNKKKGFICFNTNGKDYIAPLSFQIIHQLVNYYSYSKNLNYAFEKWHEILNLENHNDILSCLLVQQHCILRTYMKNGNNYVYGLIKPGFKPLNQLVIREKFYKILNKSQKIEDGCFDNENEILNFPLKNDELKYQLVLNYGKNNGYSYFKAMWNRLILICSNGLTTNDVKEYELSENIMKNDYENLFENIIDSGKNNMSKLSYDISRAKNTNVLKENFNNFFSRLHVSEAIKEKIIKKIDNHKKNNGISEWELSQSLTHLASHDRHSYKDTKRFLCSSGTNILEEGLENYLNDEYFILKEYMPAFESFTYAELLPKDHDFVVKDKDYSKAFYQN